MTTYNFIGAVDTDTEDQAHHVMVERIQHEEEYGFNYLCDWRVMPDPLAPPKADDQPDFDTIEAAGLDGTLRTYIPLHSEVLENRIACLTGPPMKRWIELIGSYGYDLCEEDDAVATFDATKFFALVEVGQRTRQTYITLHVTADDAIGYHTSQEYADDWDVSELTDLLTGDNYRLEVSHRAIRIEDT